MKTRVVGGACVAVVVLAMASLFPGQAQKSVNRPAVPQAGSTQLGEPDVGPVLPLIPDEGARFNPLKIALLKWSLFDTPRAVAAGNEPIGVCFDGVNIWTANFASNNVTKVRASDGEVLGTFNVGAQPYGVTFDGANVLGLESTRQYSDEASRERRQDSGDVPRGKVSRVDDI